MHPALSIIVFSTFSGAGYGLVFWLGFAAAAGLLPSASWFAAAGFGLAAVAITAALLSSTLHLGQPKRAWRAFSQWRTSWLSREGVAATVTYVPLALFAWAWLGHGMPRDAGIACGLLAALCATVTVICTAYIYGSLKPIPQWSNRWVPATYLSLAAMLGAVWLAALAVLFGRQMAAAEWLATATIVIAACLKLGYWRHIDRMPAKSTAESATGLGAIGPVRRLEAPHTAENYLMKEMGFRIARKHAGRLRRIAAQLAFILPLLLMLIAINTAGNTGANTASLLARMLVPLAAVAATLGALVERWLFFAEATHTVTLYYGARQI